MTWRSHMRRSGSRATPGSVTARTAGMLKSNQPPLTPREEKAAAEEAMAEDAAKEGMLEPA